MALNWRERLHLSLLRGEEQRLHRDIAGGYARGQYLSKARKRQNTIRGQINALVAKENS